MTNEGEVYFSLFGDDFDPDEITKLVGLAPTSTRRKGTPKPRFSSWNISSGKVENDIIDVYEMSSALVARLGPCIDQIAAAKRQFNVQAILQVVLRITTDDSVATPAIGFDSEVISFLNTVGATIDVDTYRNLP